MRITGTNISMIRGDSELLTIKAVDQNNVQMPFETGDTIYFTVRDEIGAADFKIQKTITFFLDGEAVLELEPSDTSGLYFKDYVYDIQWNKANGEVRTIVEPSEFTILAEVTYN